ncbi:hypothetical protein EHR24_04705 [Escherichia coli]|nr:hypothetical protein [Escherichia coli]
MGTVLYGYATRFGKEVAKGGLKINAASKDFVAFTPLSFLRDLYQAILIIIRIVRSIEELFAAMGDLLPLLMSLYG